MVSGRPGVGNADVKLNVVAQFDRGYIQSDTNGVPRRQFSCRCQDIWYRSVSDMRYPPVQSWKYLSPVRSSPRRIRSIYMLTDSMSSGAVERDYLNPVRRDTVNSGTPTNNVTIRFVADNAGPWFLHWSVRPCHVWF
ncbi:hypothetical protein F5I97DRAFT_1913669 [Phlebopus sp. FC_14]|nr:hypothetical protein F5I97DRAFT_1913669 [Phlebopus sp. FC_14]